MVKKLLVAAATVASILISGSVRATEPGRGAKPMRPEPPMFILDGIPAPGIFCMCL